MSIPELNDRIQGVINDLQSGAMQDIMVRAAESSLSLIKNRILNTGTDAQGVKYHGYSKWYSEYKTKAGNNKGFTDFSFTNRMWKNTQVVSKEIDEAVISTLDKGSTGGTQIVTIASHTRRTKSGKTTTIKAHQAKKYVPSNYEKLEMNTERFGVILDLSEDEKKMVVQGYNDGILDIFRRNGLELKL